MRTPPGLKSWHSQALPNGPGNGSCCNGGLPTRTTAIMRYGCVAGVLRGIRRLWGVNIDEGTIDPDTGDGRRWEVTVSPAADARQEAQRDRRTARRPSKSSGKASNGTGCWRS